MPDQEGSSRQEEGAHSMAAITYPERVAPGAAGNQPRNPRNLQGLLRFATELTRNEDAAGPSVMLPMDEERRKFLEDALNSLTIDTTAEMKLSIDLLGNREIISAINCDAEVPDDVIQAFDTLTDIIINLDMSIGLYKLDGYRIFPVCLSCENADVRSQACQLLAEICQNNPFCQTKALESGFVHTVLNILKGEDNEKVLKAALYAASCLVREHEHCTKTFLSEGGCDALVRCIQKPTIALRNKAAFLVCHIYPRYPEMNEKAIDLVNAFAIGLKNIVDECPDHQLNALRIIITSSEADRDENVLSRCSDDTVMELKETVEGHMRFCLTDIGTYMEEVDGCKDILKKINRVLKKKCNNEADTPSIDR